jgi:hypothetical protein
MELVLIYRKNAAGIFTRSLDLSLTILKNDVAGFSEELAVFLFLASTLDL